MIISDINYLEVTEVNVIGGGRFFNFHKNIDINVDTELEFTSVTSVVDLFLKDANIDVVANVEGNSASVVFDNEAIGHESNTQTVVNQIVVSGEGSSQNGSFIAVA